MRDLIELVNVVNKNKLRSLEVLASPFDNTSKIGALYEGIVNGNFETDEDAFDALYGQEASPGAYRKLKSGLRDRLLNTLFFLDVKQASYNDYQRAYYECHRDWAATKILLGKNARNAALQLSLKLLRYAEKYDFSALCMDISDSLRFHYGTIVGDRNKFEQYDEAYQRHARSFQLENQARGYYLRLAIQYVNNKSVKKEVHEQAKSYLQALSGALESSEAYQVQLYGYLIKLIVHTAIHDYEMARNVAEEAVDFFERKDYQAHVPLQIFFFQLMVCHIQLRQFDKGQVTADRCLPYLEEGSFNWFKFQELYFILGMYTQQYNAAYLAYLEAVDHERLTYLPNVVQEMWRIYGAYLHFMVLQGKVPAAEHDSRFSKFKLGRFLNETLIYSKDKDGVNVAILIIKILFFIHRNEYDRAVESIQAVEQYCYRYLRKGATYRSHCFIKMLLLIPKNHFHKAAVVRKSKPLLAKLQSEHADLAKRNHAVEIIPYEHLWAITLGKLKNQFYTLP